MGQALRVLLRYLIPISTIVLLICLPGNLLVEYLTYEVYEPDDFGSVFRATTAIEMILGPFYASGVLTLLLAVSRGEEASVPEALRGALSIWPKVFWARLFSALAILAGLIAFVVPGLILIVRLSMIDAVVVRERLGPWAALDPARPIQ